MIFLLIFSCEEHFLNINSVGKDNSIPDLTCNHKKTENNEEECNVLASHFSKVSSTNNYSDKFKTHKTEFENSNKNVYDHKQNDNSVINLPFKMSELKKALKKCKNTSPGRDMLCYEMFKHMSKYSIEITL